MEEIDIHTHQLKSDAPIQILNIFAQDLPHSAFEGYYSVGLHPWHFGLVNPEECLHSIELASLEKNMLAIGECGLDRSITTDLANQEWYFKKQIEIAVKRAKPLIIHCVKAFPELLKLKKEQKSGIPWIIHGYQGNEQTVLQLIRHNFYFSVGENLLTNPQKKDILTIIPTNRLFLETDDCETSINKIYSLAATILDTDRETLNGIILENFQRLFGNEIVESNNLT